jgi:hypothetical protein
MPTARPGPLSPDMLQQLERYIGQVLRPASPGQLAERLMLSAGDLRAHVRPPKDYFVMCAAIALVGAVACDERDLPQDAPRL